MKLLVSQKLLFPIVILLICFTGLTMAIGKEKLEVAVFEGGYGIDFNQKVGEEFAALHPDVEVEVWGNPRVGEQLRPRFISSNPPDVVYPIGPAPIDVWQLIQLGKAYPLNDILDSPAIGSDGTFGETFIPSLLESGKVGDNYYLIAGNNDVYSWWYNEGLFEDLGISVPTTYEELLEICEVIKANGIAPFTFQGRYPLYMTAGFLLPFAIRVGGIQALVDAENLVPGAWNNEFFLKAAEMTQELLEKGYFQDGALGMTHTESQVEFLQGRAAMIPCGTWLEAEMIEQIPEGFRMRMMQIPAVNPDVDPAIVGTVVNYWMVPADAKNPELGAEYLKLLFSVPNCEKWVKEKMSLTPILGTGSIAESEALLSAVEVMENSSVVFIEPFVGWTPWYPSLGKVIDDGMAALLNRDISPKEYVDTIEAEAERIRNDERIPKYTRQY